jgi:hypothetical protein
MSTSFVESRSFANLSASSSGFFLRGGKYSAVVSATGYGTAVQLQALSGDASTWVNCGSNFTANAVATFDLASGQYRVLITGATGVYFVIGTVPSN